MKMVVQTESVGNGAAAMNESGGENMAAWICGMNDLKVQPFKLPPVLGALLLSPLLMIDQFGKLLRFETGL